MNDPKWKQFVYSLEGLAVLVIVVAVLNALFIRFFLYSSAAINLGTIGDFWGGTTAPFLNFASFLLLYAALRVQRQELRAQRKQLAAQKEELAKTGEVLKGQSKTMALQRFENTFFQLLSLHHELIRALEYESEPVPVRVRVTDLKSAEGRQYFNTAFSLLKNYMMGVNLENPTQYYKDFIRRYEYFYSNQLDQIGHYFRNVYYILKLIERSKEFLSQEQQQYYANVLRAQMSSYEELLFFYYCISEYGYRETRLLAVELEMFNNLRKSLLINREYDMYILENFTEVREQLNLQNL